MSKIYIGVGHGGSDAGAVVDGIKEKDLNLAIATSCAEYLRARGIEVKQSRITDTSSTINSKVQECNRWEADYCIEIHCNAGGGQGCEAYVSKSGKGNAIAEALLTQITQLGLKNRGVKTKLTDSGKDYFGMVRDTVCPAVLVECAFMDSPDMDLMNTPARQKAMGEAIAKGVLTIVGGSSGVTDAQPTQTVNITYREGAKLSIKSGDNGVHVTILQGYLKKHDYYSMEIDGNYGPGTEAAVKKYQTAHGLTSDGKCGPKTSVSIAVNM